MWDLVFWPEIEPGPPALGEKAVAPHSSTLAWRVPWTEEPGGLQSMGLWRVGHDWATSLSLFTFMHWRRKWQPTPVFLPGESQGRWSLVGCRLWGRTESDTTEATQQQQLVLQLYHYQWNQWNLFQFTSVNRSTTGNQKTWAEGHHCRTLLFWYTDYCDDCQMTFGSIRDNTPT